MKQLRVLSIFAAISCVSPLLAQQRVNLRNTYERLICVVPMVGAGTPADPRRPLYAPLPPSRGVAPSRDGIIGFAYQVSDDGRFAIVEFVAHDRAGLKQILTDKSPDVKVFEKGKARREDIELELRKHKKDLDLDRLGVSLP